MNSPVKPPLKILLIMLEFPNWVLARPFGYMAQFGIVEGLRNIGVDCTILPMIGTVPTDASASWLHHAPSLFAGEKFDQVWLWTVHTVPDRKFLEWVASLAPVRLGLVPESLRYLPEEIAQFPSLAPRRGNFEEQLSYLTHAIVSDDADEIELRQIGKVKALWNPPAVPAAWIDAENDAEPRPQAAFFGSVYGKREGFINHPALAGLMAAPKSPEESMELPGIFDQLQHLCHAKLGSGQGITRQSLESYVEALRAIRTESFSAFLSVLRGWTAIINLPSLLKGHSGRGAESMAVGSPSIAWYVPNRPRVNTLFEDGKEILLFDGDNPESLAQKIRLVQSDRDLRKHLVANARRKLWRFHTMETRMRQILTWIESDIEPVYSDAGGGRKTDSKAAFNDFCAAHIAPYIQQISGEDQLFRSQLQEIATTLQQGDIHRAMSLIDAGIKRFPVRMELHSISNHLKSLIQPGT